MSRHAVIQGIVAHRRSEPIEHAFSYDFDLPLIDLADVQSFVRRSGFMRYNRPGVFAFHRSDFYGSPEQSIDSAVRELIAQRCGRQCTGAIKLVGMMRHFGHSFNPVSFYLCYDADNTSVEYIVAEITNTPWNQRHAYVLSPDSNQGTASHHIYHFDKQFHVSPFNGMQQHYRWEFTFDDDRIGIHMKNFEEGRCVFQADYAGELCPATKSNINRLFFKFPVAGIRALSLIYFNAFKLWLKKSPFYEHPEYQEQQQSHDH